LWADSAVVDGGGTEIAIPGPTIAAAGDAASIDAAVWVNRRRADSHEDIEKLLSVGGVERLTVGALSRVQRNESAVMLTHFGLLPSLALLSGEILAPGALEGVSRDREFLRLVHQLLPSNCVLSQARLRQTRIRAAVGVQPSCRPIASYGSSRTIGSSRALRCVIGGSIKAAAMSPSSSCSHDA
jgi:hypothetical protein